MSLDFQKLIYKVLILYVFSSQLCVADWKNMDQIYMDLARGSVSLMDLKAKIQRLESFSNDEVLSWSIQLSMDEIENCLINNKDTLVRLVDENAALKRQIQM